VRDRGGCRFLVRGRLVGFWRLRLVSMSLVRSPTVKNGLIKCGENRVNCWQGNDGSGAVPNLRLFDQV
jgi:hypothetical protein